jgi:hypothetical protein
VQDVQHESVVSANPGFVGMTSYSSIFSEEVCISGELDLRHDRNVTISKECIARSSQALAFLKDRHMINRFVSRWFELDEGSGSISIEAIFREWLLKLWLYHGDTLTSQDPEKLHRLSSLLWRNTMSPVKFNKNTTAMEWARLSTGQNIRWEVIGLIATIVGCCANTLDRSDPLLVEFKVERHTLSKMLYDVSHACLTFCRDCDSLDDMFIWLLLEHATGLLSATRGFMHYATYRTQGEVISAIINMGLHQGVKNDDEVPFFLSQLRKRTLLIAYAVEINESAFLGRPPRLSYRYCRFDLPLDLSDNDITLEGPELAAALAKLDQDGYNKAQKITRAAWMRVVLEFAKQREDILDLALGDYSRDEILRRAATIHEKYAKHWAGLPPFLARATDGAIDFAKLDPIEALSRGALRQGSRSNEMLLQRVLIRKTGASSEKLIRTARVALKEALQITQRHDIPSMWNMDFIGILVGNGLRSAAILAVELLKQEQLPAYPQNPLLPRSQTIQDLAVFSARLGTVDPTSGSFSMCEQGRKVITRILDKILTPTRPNQRQVYHATQPTLTEHPHQPLQSEIGLVVAQDSQAIQGLRTVEPLPLDPGPLLSHPLGFVNDGDFMQWLEGLDWETSLNEPWTAFP